MNTDSHNNLAFTSLAMAITIRELDTIEVSKALLIMPFYAHKELLSYLANGNTKVAGLDKLIVDKLHCFSNFNSRYYDNLVTSINAIQFLSEMDVISYENGAITPLKKIEYSNLMGSRLMKVNKASNNIIKILSNETSYLYLNLRIEL